jgi:hypothetical protein
MTGEEPYIGHCSFCGDGLLRFRRCCSCDKIVALCDECELMWDDVEGLSHDTNLSSDSCFPRCPTCGDQNASWVAVPGEELDESGLSQFSGGESV